MVGRAARTLPPGVATLRAGSRLLGMTGPAQTLQVGQVPEQDRIAIVAADMVHVRRQALAVNRTPTTERVTPHDLGSESTPACSAIPGVTAQRLVDLLVGMGGALATLDQDATGGHAAELHRGHTLDRQTALAWSRLAWSSCARRFARMAARSTGR